MRLVVRLLLLRQLSDVQFPAWDPSRLKKLNITLVSGTWQRTLMWLAETHLTAFTTLWRLRYRLTIELTKLPGATTLVVITGLMTPPTPLLGNLSGPAIWRMAPLLVAILHGMPGVAETRLRLNLCLRCLEMTLTRSKLRNLYWKLKFSVIDALGLQTSVVLPSPSPLSVLCSLGNRVPLTGKRFVHITGRGL